MKISKIDMGDYGYSQAYKLMDEKGQLLKERTFEFSTVRDFREIVEIIPQVRKESDPPFVHNELWEAWALSEKDKKHIWWFYREQELEEIVWELEVMFEKRLDVYHAQTAPLIEYYAAKGKLRSVDGMAEMDEVTRQIMEVLNG